MYYENFEKLCKINNVKPGTVSKATGISTATLTSWKQGKYTPKQDKLSLIADYFNVSVEYLMTGEENPKKKQADEFNEFIMLFNKLNDKDKENIVNLMKSLGKSN